MSLLCRDLSDEELVHLCLTRGKKDDRPHTELFRRHQAMVLRVCYGLVGNAQDAEDLAQEVFIKTFRALAQFKGQSGFKTWLYRIALNTAKNEIRRRERRPKLIEVMWEDALSEKMGSDFTYSDDALRDAISQLTTDEREVLLLKDIEKYSYEEVAQCLEIGLSAAKMRVHRARVSLSTAYRQIEAGNEP